MRAMEKKRGNKEIQVYQMSSFYVGDAVVQARTH